MPLLRVRVPATTANVGSGFDCVGIALELHDEVELVVVEDAGGVRVEVTGEGAGQVPLDESHLVARSVLAGLREWGSPAPPMVLRCRNRIPHSRGLGSSASAIVAGLALAWGLAHPGVPLDRAELTRISSRIEGHPDNAGAAVWGGAILGWFKGDDVELVRLRVPQTVGTRIWVPELEVGTAGARSVLPGTVPRADAVAQAIAAAALPLALERRPDLLLAATADRLHQAYRAELMPASYALVLALRERGVPAAISGAGPAVFAVGTPEQLTAADGVAAPGFQRAAPALGRGVELITPATPHGA